MKYDFVIFGAGFRSCYTALLASKNKFKVALLTEGKTICDFIKPSYWGEYSIDKGPQFFDDFTKKDWDLLNDLLGENIFHDIGFSYASYINNKINTDFAIPIWDNAEIGDMQEVLDSIIKKRKNDNQTYKNFDQFLLNDGGDILHPHLRKICKKMISSEAKDLSPVTSKIVTFCGRKKLFDHELSMKLKKDIFYDGIIAAKKNLVDNDRFNLYSKSGCLEEVRLSIEKALAKSEIDIISENNIEKLDFSSKKISFKNNSISYDKLIFADNIQNTERLTSKSEQINNHTKPLPQVFYFFEVMKKDLPNLNYIMNYDLNHKVSRFTNFGNYMKPIMHDKGIICAEVPTKLDSEIWNDPEKFKKIIINELYEVYNKEIDILSSFSFKAKSTYKIPLIGYEEEVNKLINYVEEESCSNSIIPDPYFLTRKNAIDSVNNIF